MRIWKILLFLLLEPVRMAFLDPGPVGRTYLRLVRVGRYAQNFKSIHRGNVLSRLQA